LKTQILDEVKTMISKNNNKNLLEDKEEGLRNFLGWMERRECGKPHSACYTTAEAELGASLTDGFEGVFKDVWGHNGPNYEYRKVLRSTKGGVAVLLQVQFTELAVGTYVSRLDEHGEKHTMGHLNELRDAVKLLPQNFRQYEKWREAWVDGLPDVNVQCRNNAHWMKRANYTCETPGVTDPVTGDIFCTPFTHTARESEHVVQGWVKIAARKCFPTHKTKVWEGLQKLQKQVQAVSYAVEALGNRILPLNYDCIGGKSNGFGDLHEIGNSEDCKRAGKAFFFSRSFSHGNWSHIPKGCQLIGSGTFFNKKFNRTVPDPREIRFNYASGRRNSVSRPICKLTFGNVST